MSAHGPETHTRGADNTNNLREKPLKANKTTQQGQKSLAQHNFSAACYTPTAVGTKLGEGKELREIRGKRCLLEQALEGDVALVEAWKADRWGNLTYRKSGRNFNPVMAMAAKLTVVQTHHVVELGEIDPEAVVTPGIFVNRVVRVSQGRSEIL